MKLKLTLLFVLLSSMIAMPGALRAKSMGTTPERGAFSHALPVVERAMLNESSMEEGSGRRCWSCPALPCNCWARAETTRNESVVGLRDGSVVSPVCEINAATAGLESGDIITGLRDSAEQFRPEERGEVIEYLNERRSDDQGLIEVTVVRRNSEETLKLTAGELNRAAASVTSAAIVRSSSGYGRLLPERAQEKEDLIRAVAPRK